MKFTGERYIPDASGHLTTHYEHLHRYLMAQQFVCGKSVLDIASGEGYGAALLSEEAQSVIGVDIDAESIEHASHLYAHHNNLRFVCGSCAQIPLEDHTIDIVTSFETIEHHNQHEQMLSEILRVMKDDGILILSSPNRKVYTDELGNHNQHHIQELDYDELVDLLSRYFKCIRIYGQRLSSASFLMPLSQKGNHCSHFSFYGGNNENEETRFLSTAVYFVALCSNDSMAKLNDVSSVFIDESKNLWNVTNSSIQQLQENSAEAQDEIQHLLARIASMESSKFWKLRNHWAKLTSGLSR